MAQSVFSICVRSRSWRTGIYIYISMTERGVYERYPLIPAYEHDKDGDEHEHEVHTTKLFDPKGSSTPYGSK